MAIRPDPRCTMNEIRKGTKIMTTKSRITVTTTLAMAVIALAVAPVSTQENQVNERFTARALAMGTSNPPVVPRSRTSTVEINITRWTTDEEMEDLFGELVENGQPALVRAFRAQEETGWIRVSGTGGSSSTRFPSERLRYARQVVAEDGSRRVILALDRPISFYEATRRPRWRDFDITYLAMDLDKDGNGEGQLAVGVRLGFIYDTKTLTVESFGTEPVRLTAIRQRN